MNTEPIPSPTSSQANKPALSKQRILLALNEAAKKIESLEQAQSEPIAIVGIGCRFPGGVDTPEAFWNLLKNGKNAITQVPSDRWNIDAYYDSDPTAPGKMYSRFGGFLDSIADFDPQSFGISPREALMMDPQQRLLLEVSWEAMENSGIIIKSQDTDSIYNKTGVFVGVTTNDYAKLVAPSDDLSRINAYYLTGNPLNAIAGRLAYTYGFHGPCMAIDTACSSSLVAVHLAVQSLRSKECTQAIAGGVNLILSPENTIALSKAQMLSADGRCKTFDASADGIVRGEGCGVVVLKRFSDALASEDNILAVIKGSAVNQDGRSSGFTVPNKSAQQALILRAVEDAKLDPTDIDYVEAHGTGTPLGDPIELRALDAALGHNRSIKTPLLVGSVKTNLGHLESAAGIAGIIKVVLSLQHKTIPAQLHFKQPNSHINWSDLPIKVVVKNIPWPQTGHPQAAGVSSFGASGTNAHIVLEEPPASLQTIEIASRQLDLLTLSAKSIDALKKLAILYADFLSNSSSLALSDICFSANTGRVHLDYRMYVIASSTEQMQSMLLQKSEIVIGGEYSQNLSQKKVPLVAFLFSGQGTQYWGMGRDLYKTQPRFRECIDRCNELLSAHLDCSLLQLLFGKSDTTETLSQTAYTQPALFVIEYALAQLWLSWGVRPAAVMGHSAGEYVAACVAGVFSLEDGLRLIAERGRLMQALEAGGGMVSVMATQQYVTELLIGTSVTIAAINGPTSVVIAGPNIELEHVVAKLMKDNVKTTTLAVSHAFHTCLMEPIIADFRKIAEQIEYRLPEFTLISNVTGEPISSDIANADYWCEHILQPVQFFKGVQALDDLNLEAYLELGPKPVLLGMARHCMAKSNALWLPSLRPQEPAWQTLFESLGQLYSSGADINWNAVDSGYANRRVVLPNYPFQRQRYWIEPVKYSSAGSFKQLQSISNGSSLSNSVHPLLGQRLALAGLSDIRFAVRLSLVEQTYLKDHCIYEQVIVPATVYIEMAIAAGQQAFRQTAIQLSSVSIQQPLVLSQTKPQSVQVVLSPDVGSTYRFEIFSLNERHSNLKLAESVWTCHAVGKVSLASSLDLLPVSLKDMQQQFEEVIPSASYYHQLASQGMAYGECFQGIQQIFSSSNEALGEARLPNKISNEGYCIHPALLDACFQILGVLLYGREQAAYLPMEIEKLMVNNPVGEHLWSQVELLPVDSSQPFCITANINLFNSDGQPAAQVRGLTLKQVSLKDLQRITAYTQSSSVKQIASNWGYRLEWQPIDLVSTKHVMEQNSHYWLIFTENTNCTLSQQLEESGVQTIIVFPSTNFNQESESVFRLDPSCPEHFSRLLNAIPLPSGIIYRWGTTFVEMSSLSIHNLQLIQQKGCGGVLHLVQALTTVNYQLEYGLWLVTRGAVALKTSTPLQPLQTSLWGLGRTISIEHPELRCRCLDLDTTEIPNLINEFYNTTADNQLAYRENSRFSVRLERYLNPANSSNTNNSDKPIKVRISDYGVLDNLEQIPMTRQCPRQGEVEIQVRSVGLNFRDVLNALGMLKAFTAELGISDARDLPFGGECSGIVAAVGEGVNDFKVGDAVIAAQTIGSLSSFVNVPTDFVVHKPCTLSFDEAATIPTAFLTAYHALKNRAQLQAGERVLIHSAAGGVGQAAVQIALWLKAIPFGTASKPKWDALRESGVENVFNSRSTEFAQQVLGVTEGEGVHVVLNSLNGEFIPSSLLALGQEGRFIEIGKLGIWTKEQMKVQRPDVHYEPFDLLDISLSNRRVIRKLLREIMPLFETRKLKPLNHISFPINKVADAFRFMAQTKHVGKVVITFPETVLDPFSNSSDGDEGIPVVSQQGTYLITGGLGALGLQLGQWLVDNGAKQLALLGRSKPSHQAAEVIAQLREGGVTVQVLKADVACKKSLEQAISFINSPIKGVFHAAGILDDAILQRQSWQSFEKVMRPKVTGTWVLHTLLSKQPLDFFVCFSSVSAILGSPGQANYAAANAFMDGFAQYRRRLGLSSLSINWGPWASSGMAAASNSHNQARWASQGIDLIDPAIGLSFMFHLLEDPQLAQAVVLPVDWQKYFSHIPSTIQLPFLQRFVQYSQLKKTETTSSFLAELAKTATKLKRPLLLSHLQSQLSSVLGFSADHLDPHKGLSDLGMDSLMSIELHNRLQASLGCSIPNTLAFDYPTIAEMSNYLADVLELPEVDTEQSLLITKKTVGDTTSTDSLSEAEAEAMLMSELESLRY